MGRFLSADPFIQFSTNTQSYNRYTYVLNNPLSLTDPTGYLSKTGFDVIRTIVSIAIAVLMPPTATLPMIMAVNAASTTVLTYMATGSLETAMAAGFQAGIMSGLSAGVSDAIGGSKVIGDALGGWGAHIAHGVAQGTLSVLQGGKFGSRFAAGFMGHGARNLGARLGFGFPGDSEGLVGRTVVAVMVGGLSSKITGGTFANGAISAAFVHLFNAEGMHYDPLPPQEDYDPNNVMSGFNEYGESLVYHPDHYDPSAASAILLCGAGMATACSGSAALAGTAALARTSSAVTVTSWASTGMIPDLAAGRWVMIGGATRWNYIKTGLWGLQYEKGIGIYKTTVPFSNSITGQVSSASLQWPRGWEAVKVVFGQRVIK